MRRTLKIVMVGLALVGAIPAGAAAAHAPNGGGLVPVGNDFTPPSGGFHIGSCPGAGCPFNYHNPGQPTPQHPCPGQPKLSKLPFYLGTDVATDSSGNLQSVTQTIGIGVVDGGYMWQLTAPSCWQFAGSGSSTTLAAFGTINVNGVWLVPQDGRSELLVTPENGHGDAGGTIIRASNPSGPAIYSIEVPSLDTDALYLEQGGGGGSPVVIGQVDLGADSGNVWVYNSSSRVLGDFGSSPQGATFDGRADTGGQIIFGAIDEPQGQASTAIYIPLPSILTTAPSGGPAASGVTYFYTQNGLLDSAAGGSGSSSGGGGGGGLPPPPTGPGSNLCQNAPRAPGCSPIRYMQAPDRPRRNTDVGNGQPLQFSVPDLYLGGLEIQNVFITFDPSQDGGCGGLWSGSGDMSLLGYEASGSFQACGNGSFLGGNLQVSGDAPIIPGVIDLTGIGAGVHLNPTKLTGNATVSVAGGLVTIPGCLLIVFANSSQPYTYNAGDLGQGRCQGVPGTLQRGTGPITSFAAGVAGSAQLNVPVFGSIPFASGYGFYVNPGYFEFAGNFDFHVLIGEFKGGVNGWFELNQGKFSLAGNFDACLDFPDPIGSACVGANGNLTSAGVGGCAGINVLGHTFGVYGWYAWNGSSDIDFGCDLGPIQVHPAADAQAGSPITITVPKGVPVTSIRLHSSAAPPEVTVSGPGGRTASNPTGGQGAFADQIAIAPLQKLHQTVVGIFGSGGGTWTITPVQGSPAITSFEYRNGVGRARVKARVSGGHGKPYVLAYKLRFRRGQQVTFVERARDVYHVIGQATGKSGTLSFKPALGPAGRRQLIAQVTLAGEPDGSIVAGSYRAPGTPRAGAARKLRLGHKHGALTVSWTPGANTGDAVVQLVLSDGRRLLVHVRRGRHTLTLPRVQGQVGAQVTVLGVGPDGALGSPATGKLNAGTGRRVHKLTATATSKGVVVRWQPVKHAVAYLIHVIVVGAVSGRLVAFSHRPALPPSKLLAALGPGTSARISVRAIDSGGDVGPPGKVVYRG